ncbi:MAG TPA: methyltransferase domain-containing protein [Vicinamibacterales bacterium]|nr:methyltransferase domain-containing protein [Vicinamibacterales bacterium]
MTTLSIITPTHDLKYLPDAWASIKDQGDFEWIVLVNASHGLSAVAGDVLANNVRRIVENDPRVIVKIDPTPFTGVGARKKTAFGLGTSDVLIELDHDDMLLPGALDAIRAAFEDPAVGFVYTDAADFVEGADTFQGNLTYRHPDVRRGWLLSGFSFYEAEVGGVRPGTYEFVHSHPATARWVSHIYTAPNHVRCWRRSVYEAVGGHDPTYPVGDDHELICRTFLATKILHVEKPLYLYRIVPGGNTWSSRVDEIKGIADRVQSNYLERLVLRECAMLGLPAYDLGGGIDGRPGWITVDRAGAAMKYADLMQPWPFEDGSVGAFRASDLLEHLPDKQFTMREIHRCLRPGGWLLSMTPSTDGRGAFMDPTHVSFFNENSFWYWTRDAQARYINNNDVRFSEVQLFTEFPSDWHRANNISYVHANLVKR